jgi:hypothetical protein
LFSHFLAARISILRVLQKNTNPRIDFRRKSLRVMNTEQKVKVEEIFRVLSPKHR